MPPLDTPVPVIGYGDARQDGSEDGPETGSDDDGHEGVAGSAGWPAWEDAEVLEEDGEFCEGQGEVVERD